MKKRDTSWNNVSGWYSKKIGTGESYFHQNIVIPKLLKILNLKHNDKLLDLACGEGILSRKIPKILEYLGIDLADGLINQAKKQNRYDNTLFKVADVSKPLFLPKNLFTHCTVVLAIQNIENPHGVIENARDTLVEKGKLVIVMNHPSFRIPRQSGWDTNPNNKIQYRWINKYMSQIKIPIDMTPGSQSNKKLTWSFHRPLEFYTNLLRKNGFVIENIEEWVSDKTSVGKKSKSENTAREEFPMFMTICARKLQLH